MKPKLTFLLALTFLFLFSGSVYGQEEMNIKENTVNKMMNISFDRIQP